MPVKNEQIINLVNDIGYIKLDSMKKEIREAIVTTLIVENNESIHFAVDKIKLLIEQKMEYAYDKGFKDGKQRDLTGSLIENL